MKAGSQRPFFELRQVGFFMIGGTIGVLLLLICLIFFTDKKLWPLITIGSIPVGGLTQSEATTKLTVAAQAYAPTLQYGESLWSIPQSVWHFEIDKSIAQALQAGFFLGHAKLPLFVTLEEEAWNTFIEEKKSVVEIPSTAPSLSYTKGVVTLQNGSDGIMLDEPLLRQRLLASLSDLNRSPIVIPTQVIKGSLNSDTQTLIQEWARKLVGKKLTLIFDDEKIILQTPELLSFLSLTQTGNAFDREAIVKYVGGIASRFAREPANARLRVEGEKVVEFAPGKDGIAVKVPETTNNVLSTLTDLLGDEPEKSTEIVVERTAPQVATGDVNTLGLQTRIGRGESFYTHSIVNRVFNVGFTAGKINGILIAPGDEFSFLKTVGDITAATGFKPAYVISGGRTVLGDGGGVCQVSTTLFRAAMNAGLPIVERWAHAYRVGYYEQNSKPGFDATIYYPSKDFRFKNDTSHYLLLYVVNDPKTLHLTIDIYGTPDGRVATISPGRLSGVTPPPPNLFQDDPSLPLGTMKQVDWSAWGGKAAFDYKVERDGETLFSRTYVSVYKPWQNVYLRGTAQ